MALHPARGKTNRKLSQRHFAIFETERASEGGGGGGDPPLLKCSWTGGVVDFKDGLPGADSIFLIQLQLIKHFFNSLTNEKGVSNKQRATMHSSTIICPCFIYFKSLSVLSLRVSRSFL